MPVNFSNTNPAAPASSRNISWQKSGTDVSAYVPLQAYDVSFYLAGKPGAGAIVFKYVFPRVVSFEDQFAGAKGDCDVNPASTAVYDMHKNGVSIGSISIGTGGVFTFSSDSGGSPSFAADDVLTVIAPNPQDAALEGVGVTLAGMCG
jgi:hypothetical protein